MEPINIRKILKNIIDDLEKLYKTYEELFYLACIDYIKIHTKIRKTHILTNIKIVEPFRLYVYANFDKFVCMLVDTELNTLDSLKPYIVCKIQHTYTKYAHARSNMLRQLWALETDDLNNLKTPLTELNENYQQIAPILIISPIANADMLTKHLATINIKYIRIYNKCSLNMFLCNNTYRFLKHQDLDRFCKYMMIADGEIKKPPNISKKRVTEIKNSVHMFRYIYKFYKELEQNNNKLYQRLMLYSDFVLHTLGTTIMNKAETFVFAYNVDLEDFEKYKIILKEHNKNDNIRYLVYTTRAHTLNIVNTFFDPANHYYFMGLKIISYNFEINLLNYQADALSFMNLISLKEVNKINTDLCYPLITLHSDTIRVYDKKNTDKLFQTIQKYFIEHHGTEYTIDELKLFIKPCNSTSNTTTLNKNKHEITLLIEEKIKELILEIAKHNFADTLSTNHYNEDNIDRNYESWLIVDDGVEYPLNYTQNTQTRIIVTEPLASQYIYKIIDRYKSEEEKATDTGISLKYNIIGVDYNSNWGSDVIDALNGQHANNIIMNYTNKYINRPKFVKALSSVAVIGSKLLIIRIDEKQAKKILSDDNKSQIEEYLKNVNDLKSITGIFKYDDDCVFYLNSNTRYGEGRIESLSDPVDILESNGFKRLTSQNMYDYFMKYEKKIYRMSDDDNINNLIERSLQFVLAVFKYDIYIKISKK